MKPLSLAFWTLGAFVASSAANLGLAQESASSPNTYFEVQEALESWRSQAGQNWRITYDKEIGRAQFIWGGQTEAIGSPDSDGQWFSLAREWASSTYNMHGVDDLTLTEDRVKFIPMGMVGSTDKIAVRFRQEVNTVPVQNGWFNLIFTTDGNLLAVDSTGQPGLENFDTGAGISAFAAIAKAQDLFQDDFGLSPDHVGTPELMIAQVEQGKFRVPVLTWEINTLAHPDSGPVGSIYRIDAKTGLLANKAPSVHNFDVSGTVRTLATPGLAPDTNNNGETSQVMPYVRVSSSQGSVNADANGNFNIPGATAPLQVTVSYDGLFSSAVNQAGSNYSLSTTLNSNSGNTVNMNPNPTEEVTAAANTYVWFANMRDWIRSIDPTDNSADFDATCNVNVNSTCNATWSGNATNFYNAGGGCVNTAYSTVVAHEEGHWMNSIYGSGNGPDGFGEGNADVWAMYLTDNPTVGQGFSGNGTQIRSGNNNLQFCGDCCNGCFGQVHTDGLVLMGALWKVRQQLKGSLGDTAGQNTANSLFLGWMNAFNDGQIKTVIEEHWLALDDNDGNILNGTPNYSAIDAGFVQQGFPSFVLPFVTISNVTDLADTENDAQARTVQANMDAQFNPPLVNPTLLFSVDGGPFASVPMSNVGGGTYSGQIPAVGSPHQVRYYVTAGDSSGNNNSFPADAPATTLDYLVGILSVSYFDGFETDTGWTHDLTANQDDWQRSAEVGSANGSFAKSGDPDFAFSGTQIWGNDLGPDGWNGAYQDNTSNFLRSPNIDLSGVTAATLSFQRWLTVESGQFDQATVKINGQTVWSNPQNDDLIDSSWVETTVDITSIAAGNPNVQIEFALDTDGGAVFGGWNIDDVRIFELEAASAQCETENYCVGKVNSLGFVPVVGASGEPDVGTGSFTISAFNALPFRSGIYFYGFSEENLPFLGGTLCITPPLVRGPISVSDAFGTFSWDIDVDTDMVGTERFYQVWSRDPDDLQGVSLTGGLRVSFCD